MCSASFFFAGVGGFSFISSSFFFNIGGITESSQIINSKQPRRLLYSVTLQIINMWPKGPFSRSRRPVGNTPTPEEMANVSASADPSMVKHHAKDLPALPRYACL